MVLAFKNISDKDKIFDERILRNIIMILYDLMDVTSVVRFMSTLTKIQNWNTIVNTFFTQEYLDQLYDDFNKKLLYDAAEYKSRRYQQIQKPERFIQNHVINRVDKNIFNLLDVPDINY